MSGVPVPVGRFVALSLTPLYLWLLAVVLSRASTAPFEILVTVVCVGAGTLVVIIAILSHRFANLKPGETRYSINTLMLLTIGFSIYLAYISQFLQAVREQPVSPYGIATFLYYFGFLVVVSTIVLFYFTDAALAILAFCLRVFRR